MTKNKVSFAFAGDRDISVSVLNYLLKNDFYPKTLLISGTKKASHYKVLRNKCPFLPDELIFMGKVFRETDSINALKKLNLDLIISVHFPYIIPKGILSIPKIGTINLHPAYLPFNRGWHTPTWAILQNTPIGATLHFMNEEIDAGDIIHQKKLSILPDDTANSLYQRIKALELKVFKEAWPFIFDGTFKRTKQVENSGTTHWRKDLFIENIQEINLQKQYLGIELINRIRALTTNDINEAAYFIKNNKKYRIQVKITEE